MKWKGTIDVLQHLVGEVLVLARKDRQARLILILAALLAASVLMFGGLAVWRFFFPRVGMTYAVQGMVTYQGKPLESGEIAFEPEPGGGQLRTAMIKGGAFSLSAKEGLPRGKTYTLRLKSYRKTGKQYENADMSVSADISEQILPAKYNSESKLKFESTAASLRTGLSLRID